jgi:hypothetical protein
MRRLTASATLGLGIAIGFAAAAHAQPNNSTMSDYWECVADHPDKVGAETCCVFYGGTWDPSQYLYECSLDRGGSPKSRYADAMPGLSITPGSSAPPKAPELTRTPALTRG